MTFRFDQEKPVQNKLQQNGFSYQFKSENRNTDQQESQSTPSVAEDLHEKLEYIEPSSLEPQDMTGTETEPRQDVFFESHAEVHTDSLLDSNYTKDEKLIYQTVDWGDPFVDHTDLGGGIYTATTPELEPKPTSSYYQYRSRSTNWWKLSGSIAGAILTGVLFGVVVLSVFNQEISLPIPTGGVPSQSDPATSVTTLEETSKIPPVGIELPDKTYYFLQYGVFSTAQGVQLAQEELQASGIAAARDTIDEKRVYAGVSSEREQAKLLGNELKTKGVNLIIHEVVFPQAAVVEFQGQAPLLESYIAESLTLADLLSTASADRLQQEKAKAQEQSEIAELQKVHQAWITAASEIQGKFSVKQNEVATTMEKAMNSAVEAMSEFNKSGAKTLLWEVQNELMKFIMAQRQLLGHTS